jgi:hypothetical protein
MSETPLHTPPPSKTSWLDPYAFCETCEQHWPAADCPQDQWQEFARQALDDAHIHADVFRDHIVRTFTTKQTVYNQE